MDRTPIKIPGKRKSKPKAKNETASSSQPRGRPLKLTASNKMDWDTSLSSSPAPSRKKRSMKNIKSKKQMSLLEKLPVELLEMVYLFAMDISLPRSSPVVAGKLSREAIYLQTAIEAFRPTWQAVEPLSNPTTVSRVTSVDTPIVYFQSAILRCRWASVPIFVKARDQWFESHSQHLSDWSKRIMFDDLLDGEWPNGLTAETYFNANFARFTNFHPVDGVDDEISWIHDYDVAKGVEIPEKLLLGPWSEEQIKLLFWMVKSGAKVDYCHSTSGEVSSQGLRSAIAAGDVRAIHLLLRAQPHRKLDNLDTLILALRTAGGNRFQVVSFIMTAVAENLGEGWHTDIIESEMDELRSKAMREKNHEELVFIDAIHETYRHEQIQNRKLCQRK